MANKKAETQENKPEYKDHKWYIINTYSGHENKVATQILQRVKANGLEDQISEVLVPMQDKIVVSGGKKRTVKEKVLPGYVLIKMIVNDNTWQIIRNTEGVTNFVGNSKKPTPLSEEEAKSIHAYITLQQPSYQSSFAVGDAVKVVDGNFKDFVGTVNEINQDKGQVQVLLSIFGRETPVLLDFLQVTKL